MAKTPVTTMPAARDALATLGSQIRLARHDRGWTAADLAARIGVSPRTILAVEAGAPGTAVGTVFNAAVMTGVALFGVEDKAELTRMRHRGEERLALIPSRVYRGRGGEPAADF